MLNTQDSGSIIEFVICLLYTTMVHYQVVVFLVPDLLYPMVVPARKRLTAPVAYVL